MLFRDLDEDDNVIEDEDKATVKQVIKLNFDQVLWKNYIVQLRKSSKMTSGQPEAPSQQK